MKSVLLIGLGKFGKQIAFQLNQLGHQVMGVDQNEQNVNDAMDIVTNAQIGDSTNQEFLRSLGIDNFDLCIVAIGDDFQSSLETTCSLKELGAQFVLSRADSDVQAKFLLRNGADKVVYPEKQVARWAAIRYSSDNILNYVEIDDNNSIYEVTIPKAWLGKTIGQIDIRKKYNINIIAVKENGKTNVAVTPDTLLTEDRTLLIIGEDKALHKCFHI